MAAHKSKTNTFANAAEAEEFIRLLRPSLPPVIAREKVEMHLGGIVNGKTLANYDCRGKGPEESFSVGRKVVYKTDSLLKWVVATLGVKRIVNNIKSL